MNRKIDTKKLSVGMTVKNYKALCELLSQDVKTGNSKKAQITDFKCYFDWKRSGQQFIITDIYDTPLCKDDKRKEGNNSIYIPYIEKILLMYLKSQGNTDTLTKKGWWELLGFINHNYIWYTEDALKKLDHVLTPWEIRHFYMRSDRKLTQIFFSALNNLKNRNIISYEIEIIIVLSETEYIKADELEKEKIEQMEKHVLNDIMGFDTMFQVFASFKIEEFYRKVNELLYDAYRWIRYFKNVKISLRSANTDQDVSEMALEKKLLNEKIVEYLNQNAIEFYNKNMEKYQTALKEEYWGDISQFEHLECKVWSPPDTYLEAQTLLTDKLIKI